MPGSSYNVHGESITDGSSAAGIPVILYNKGSATVRILASTEVLHVTDIYVQVEDGGNFVVYNGSNVAGKVLFTGNLQANGGILHAYSMPFICLPGQVPTLIGSSTNRNTLIIAGFIRES